ncbi:MAG: VCBS repeat-containing protein [Rhodanobacteraceae bacterium]|nr:VCBS repeat-containing protein [Rhodanobacteraceae bacterium]
MNQARNPSRHGPSGEPQREPAGALRAIRRIVVVVLVCVLAAACSPQPRRPALTPEAAARARDAQSACRPARLRATQRFAASAIDTGLPDSGQWRDGFVLADMNGDSRPDLLVGPARKGAAQPTIFLGDGQGRFQEWKEVHFPPLPYDYGDVKAADFNGDGRLDIALSAHLRGLAVLINEGGGHYAPWGHGLVLRLPAESVLEPVFTSRALAVTDWNRDGKLDLLALNEGPSRLGGGGITAALGLWFNRGGLWDFAKPEQVLNSFGTAIAVGDIDGDGHPDALIGTSVAGNRLLLQKGDGNLYRAGELRSVPLAAAVTAVALHDFDGDGSDEAVTASRAVENTQFCVSLQAVRAAGSRKEIPLALWSTVSRDSIAALAIGDIDRDGRDDLVAVREDGGVLTFAGSGRSFSRDLSLAPIEAMNGCKVFDAQLADIDADGSLELIIAYAGEDSIGDTTPCRGNGGFRAWRLRPVGSDSH